MIAKTYGHFLLERDEYGRTTNNYGTLVSYIRWKAKTLNNENGQSFIENLGLAMEQVYTNERGLFRTIDVTRST